MDCNNKARIVPLDVRFWRLVDKSRGDKACWLWLGTKLKAGYGTFGVDGKPLKAHRVAFELTYGLIPDGNSVCHNCPGGDNPSCVNPSHLFTGTHADNMRDKDNKGRANHPVVLTDLEVLEIRNLHKQGGYTHAKLAVIFNTSRSNVTRIVNGKTRKSRTILNKSNGYIVGWADKMAPTSQHSGGRY
jgi:hypothetical protein